SRTFGGVSGAVRVFDRLAVAFGPAGLALDSIHQRLYVLNQLDATLSVVNLRTRESIATVALRYDPTPAVVKKGRPFLYDANLTSRNGDLSCATCHLFGDLDGLAWDLWQSGRSNH